jgi:citrate synthase
MAKSTRKTPNVERRKTSFSQRIKSKIWSDSPCPDNPYIAQKSLVHGYDVLDIADNLSFSESIFLNIKGELPSTEQLDLFNGIFSGLSNLGPRHAAVRAVMNAAVSKTHVQNLLPIGMSIASGEFLGAVEVENSIRFIRKHINQPPANVAKNLLSEYSPAQEENSVIAPGFGSRFGGIDLVSQQLAALLRRRQASDKGLNWAHHFCEAMAPAQLSWLITGVAAASFVDLGFTPKAGAGLFQLATAPGMLAHGLEMAAKPITAMPFVDDENYIQKEDLHEE